MYILTFFGHYITIAIFEVDVSKIIKINQEFIKGWITSSEYSTC